MGYSFLLAARVLLYAPSHRQDSTYHSLCYTSRGALAGMRNSWMVSHWRIDPTIHRTMCERSYHGATPRSTTMSDWSDDPSHHEQTPLPRSYISLPHHEGSIRRPIAPWANAVTTELHLAPPPWRIDPTTHRTMSYNDSLGVLAGVLGALLRWEATSDALLALCAISSSSAPLVWQLARRSSSSSISVYKTYVSMCR